MTCLHRADSHLWLWLTAALALAGHSACSFDKTVTPYTPPNAEPLLGCNSVCHGDAYSVAPPNDLQGNTDTARPGVGAHRAHLQPAPGWHLPVECVDCHVVPGDVVDPGHIDGDDTAELTFSDRATQNGLLPIAWENNQCTNAYCHGAATSGGALVSPVWTEPSGQPLPCNTCHGFPPPPPHSNDNVCGTCHPTVSPVGTPDADSFLDPNSHINGIVDTAPAGEPSCDSCHGGEGVAAPPNDLSGNTDVSAPGVGAHRAHVSQADWRRTLYCSQCHITPTYVDDPQHLDGDGQAEVVFDSLNPSAQYDSAANTCTNLYCHGDGQGEFGTMAWTQDLPDLRNNCGACHSEQGDGLSGSHGRHISAQIECAECHASVVDGQRNFTVPDLHINGVHEVNFSAGGVWDVATRVCDVACHQVSRNWY